LETGAGTAVGEASTAGAGAGAVEPGAPAGLWPNETGPVSTIPSRMPEHAAARVT